MRPALAAVLAAALAAPAWPLGGGTAGTTLTRPWSARAAGMADAFGAVDGGIDSLGSNPAGLARQPWPELRTTYTRGLAEDTFTGGAWAQPTPWATFAAGLLYYDAGTIGLRLSSGLNEDRKAQQDFVALAAVAVPLPGGLSLGATGKGYRFDLAEEAQATGFSADAGAAWRTPVPGLSFGAAVQNAGPDVKYEEEGDPLPLTLRGGAAYLLDLERFGVRSDLPYTFTKFLFSADAVKARDERVSPRFGLEMDLPFGPHGHGLLRLGYAVDAEADGLAIGFGVREKRVSVDYAAGFKQELGATHTVSLGLHF